MVITNEQADELMTQGVLDEDGEALLSVWRLFKQPTSEVTILIDSDFQYAFNEFGDCLGVVDWWGTLDQDCFFFDCFSGVSYVGSKEPDQGTSLRFTVKVAEHSLEKVLDLNSTH